MAGRRAMPGKLTIVRAGNENPAKFERSNDTLCQRHFSVEHPIHVIAVEADFYCKCAFGYLHALLRPGAFELHLCRPANPASFVGPCNRSSSASAKFVAMQQCTYTFDRYQSDRLKIGDISLGSEHGGYGKVCGVLRRIPNANFLIERTCHCRTQNGGRPLFDQRQWRANPTRASSGLRAARSC